MAYLNLSTLSTTMFESAQRLNADVSSYSRTSRHQIFLSYRHVDRPYVPGIVQFLKRLQTGIYVDFLDQDLANAPDSQTATILRRRINESHKLIQLLSPNSTTSRWMPWELGLGDGLLGYTNTVTLPTVTNNNREIQKDFLAMYGHIESNSFNTWTVYYPDGKSKSFVDWLRA